MKLPDTILTANRNLLHSKLRTVLTIMAIFVGGFTLTLTTALNTGANDYLQRQLGNVAVPGIFEVLPKTDLNPFGSGEPKEYDPAKKQISTQQLFTASLDKSDVERLQKVAGIESVTPFYMLSPEYITREGGKKYQVQTLEQHFGLNLDLAAGRLPKEGDDHVIVLAEDYLKPLDFTAQSAVDQKITVAYKDLYGQLQEETFTVVGVMRKTFVTSGAVFIDAPTAKQIADAQGQGSRYIALMAKFKDATEVTDESALKQKLQDAGNYTAVSLKERVGTLTSVIGAVTAGLNVVGIIALFAASFGIINTLLMSVYERTQEIGLMKALGMHRRTVFALFAIEAVLVGFWGSALASLAGWGVSMLLNDWASSTFLKDFEGFNLLVVTPLNAALVIGAIMLVAFLAGTLPAIKASRLNPIEALRSE